MKRMLCRPLSFRTVEAGDGGDGRRAKAARRWCWAAIAERRSGGRGGAATGRGRWRDQFCETLADTCNVTLAAAAIGRSIDQCLQMEGARMRSFRAAWDAALAIGYSRLELMLLERALHGVEKIVVARDGTSTVMREYPRPRRADPAADAPRDGGDGRREPSTSSEYEEACERIIAKLGGSSALASDAKGDATVETKGRGRGWRSSAARCAARRSAAGCRRVTHEPMMPQRCASGWRAMTPASCAPG